VRILERRGLALKLTVAGGGDIEQWRSRASQFGVERQVEFAGLVSHSEVRKLMRRHDMVLVPSRHDYAEGLPNTIYEALAARSPLIMSDHPAFRGRLADGEEALVFGAADPSSLAASIERLLADPDLYQRLSERSEAAHDSLYIGMEFKELVLEFLRDPHDRTGWVKRHSLAVLAARP
jgi:glycosyltransferase involved in cell wall biosynthesis